MSSVHPAITAATRDTSAPIFIGGHSASLSGQIVAQVRDALFAKKLKPGDFIGTEKDLAARFGVSRIVARDALRTLQALALNPLDVRALSLGSLALYEDGQTELALRN
jgi:hypothetical protein